MRNLIISLKNKWCLDITITVEQNKHNIIMLNKSYNYGVIC